jgi:hypothetical protein
VLYGQLVELAGLARMAVFFFHIRTITDAGRSSVVETCIDRNELWGFVVDFHVSALLRQFGDTDQIVNLYRNRG